MKKHIVLVTIILTLVYNTRAQKSRSFNSSTYTTALGVKVYPGAQGAAVTFKHFIKQSAALEVLGSAWERGGRITGLYEFHWAIPSAPGLKWYVGPGVHVSFYDDKDYSQNRFAKSYVAPGIDGVIGLDYKFNKIPLNLSADWQPSIEFGNERYNGFGADFGGIAARYTF